MKLKFLSVVLLLFALSCDKDDDVENVVTDAEEMANDNEGLTLDLGVVISTTITGTVLNIDGKPLSEVKITIGSESLFTDINGSFVFEDAQVHEKLGYIKASKPGYINGSRSIYPSRDKVNTVSIMLLRPRNVATVNSGEEATVELFGNALLDLKGDYIDASGNPYDGAVNVSLNYLYPSQSNVLTAMPGMLYGARENGDGTGMETYGMMEVSLTSGSGDPLNLAPDSAATLSFPIDTDQQATAPTTIPLWSFDEDKGYWLEEGAAQKIGNMYVGEVSHFTWWNVDDPVEVVDVCLEFELDNGQPLAGNYVTIKRNATDRFLFTGLLGPDGLLCGKFPKGETFTLKVYGDPGCVDVLYYEAQLGAYNDDSTEQVIIDSNVITSTRLTATVTTCGGNVLDEGVAYIYRTLFSGNSLSHGPIIIRDGILDYQMTYCDTQEYVLLIIDPNTGESSDFIPINISGSITPLGNLATCVTTDGVYQGDLFINSQFDMDIFGLFDYTAVEGNVRVTTYFDDINFDAFETVRSIGGSFTVTQTYALENIEGLRNLESIGDRLRFSSVPSLTSLEPLRTLNASLNYLQITDLNLIENLEGLENISLNEGGDFILGGNLSLTDASVLADAIPQRLNLCMFRGYFFDCGSSCSGTGQTVPLADFSFMSNLQVVDEHFSITDQGNTTMAGFENFSESRSMQLGQLNLLEDISQLNSLSVVTGGVSILLCEALTNLDGLENLSQVGSIKIGGETGLDPNVNLSDFCALQNLFINGTYDPSEVEIVGNAYNPTVQDIIDGNCSN
jgi:hypothetical protein